MCFIICIFILTMVSFSNAVLIVVFPSWLDGNGTYGSITCWIWRRVCVECSAERRWAYLPCVCACAPVSPGLRPRPWPPPRRSTAPTRPQTPAPPSAAAGLSPLASSPWLPFCPITGHRTPYALAPSSPLRVCLRWDGNDVSGFILIKTLLMLLLLLLTLCLG